MKLVKLIDNVFVCLVKIIQYFENDYDCDYIEYCVIQVFVFGSKDCWGEMWVNEIVVWFWLLDIDVFEFFKVGVGVDKLILWQVSILYKIEIGENFIFEIVEFFVV